MTTNDIIIRTRQIIEDTAGPYRWKDEDLRSYVQIAMRRLNSLAPATRYVDGALVDGIDIDDYADDGQLPVNGRYLEPLSLYVAYLAYHNDATDTVNSERAAACLQRAERMMV